MGPNSKKNATDIPFLTPAVCNFRNRYGLGNFLGKLHTLVYIFNLMYICTLISLIAEEVGINVEGGIFWKKLEHNSNKREVEGGKNLRNQ